jgi:hypothetical protein
MTVLALMRETPACTGNGSEHCCYVEGKVCTFLEEGTVPGRRWACGLLRECGSWEAVHADARYAPIQAAWDKVGIESCGAWMPKPGQCCREGEVA